MSQVRRHELIVDFVNRHGFANIEQLTSHFMVDATNHSQRLKPTCQFRPSAPPSWWCQQ